jgi:hypothetical protein
MTIVNTSADLAVQRQISFNRPVAASLKVTVNCSPAEGFGKRAPVPVATIQVVSPALIALANVVWALFVKR